MLEEKLGGVKMDREKLLEKLFTVKPSGGGHSSPNYLDTGDFQRIISDYSLQMGENELSAFTEIVENFGLVLAERMKEKNLENITKSDLRQVVQDAIGE